MNQAIPTTAAATQAKTAQSAAGGDALPENSLVCLRAAGYRHRGRWLVQGVDLDVRRGEIVTLVGPNGSGKSTTARMALGVYKPDAGNALRLAGLKVGYVPQKLSIDWTVPLTVSRFLDLTEKIHAGRAASALQRTGVPHLAESQLVHLSGGEFQRVLLARAIAREPDLLVLDEPVQGVDFNGQISLYELIASIRDEIGCGVLLISHDLHLVMAATDQVVCLNGHVCCSGTPSSVAVHPEYHALFGERATATLAIYEHDHDHTHLPDGRVQLADGTITDSCPPDSHGHAD